MYLHTPGKFESIWTIKQFTIAEKCFIW
jgi:hypothetical protein